MFLHTSPEAGNDPWLHFGYKKILPIFDRSLELKLQYLNMNLYHFEIIIILRNLLSDPHDWN